MATFKLKHLILYFITFAFLYFSQIPGGALLSIAAWMQVCVLLYGIPFTVNNQIRMLIYFLTLLPLFLFLGSTSSFILIYLKEGSILFLMFAASLTFIICFFVSLLLIFSFEAFKTTTTVSQIYTTIFQQIKNRKAHLALSSLILMILILLPLPIRQDFKISLSLILIHLYLRRQQVRAAASLR